MIFRRSGYLRLLADVLAESAESDLASTMTNDVHNGSCRVPRLSLSPPSVEVLKTAARNVCYVAVFWKIPACVCKCCEHTGHVENHPQDLVQDHLQFSYVCDCYVFPNHSCVRSLLGERIALYNLILVQKENLRCWFNKRYNATRTVVDIRSPSRFSVKRDA